VTRLSQSRSIDLAVNKNHQQPNSDGLSTILVFLFLLLCLFLGRHFSKASLLRLVGAMLMETDEEWQKANRYLDMKVENQTLGLNQSRNYTKNVT